MLKSLKKRGATSARIEDSRSAAILVADDGRLIDRSHLGESLAEMWRRDFAPLVEAVAETQASGVLGEYHFENEAGAKIWLTTVPQAGATLLIARDTELVEKMAEALLESRILLKSLLDGAVDLSFQVGVDGCFSFVSPAEAFGCSTEAWLGRKAVDIFWSSGRAPARSPLIVNEKTRFEPVRIEISGDKKRSVAMTVEPAFAKDGTPLGIRGTCRDISDRIEKDRQKRQEHLRVAVQQRITRILNASENAQELLESASTELIDVLRADLVWSVMKNRDGLVPVSTCGDSAEDLNLENIWSELEQSEQGVREIKGANRNHLALRLDRAERGIGMVVISRDTSVSPWSKQELQLLDDIGDVLTAAFGKAELIDRLSRLSGKDELTDLLNRRAFKESVERRLKHQCRTGKAGCLVFIDLDHFKEVNDTLGHKAGDEAIILVANKLQKIIRASDYAGRFGGDEFVLWIEDADEKTAEIKAQKLLEYMPDVREKIGNPDLGLGASVGICRSTPGKDLCLTDLTERADAALYEVKKAGKNAIAFAPNSSEDGE